MTPWKIKLLTFCASKGPRALCGLKGSVGAWVLSCDDRAGAAAEGSNIPTRVLRSQCSVSCPQTRDALLCKADEPPTWNYAPSHGSGPGTGCRSRRICRTVLEVPFCKRGQSFPEMKPASSSPEQLVPRILRFHLQVKFFSFLFSNFYFQRCKAAKWMGVASLSVNLRVSALWRQHPKSPVTVISSVSLTPVSAGISESTLVSA